ncbi:MAG TPA: DUF86 domain-containing protein [Bacillota bacterium]|nr:DUF86 domain-containing protein [Bacillota bacterium]
MEIDAQRIASRIAYAREQVVLIESLLGTTPPERIISDPWTFGGLKYALQTAIEALVDIAYHICAKLYRHPPTDARDALVVLAQQGVIAQEDLGTYLAMVGFRNRLVHGYLGVTAERVYDIARDDLRDIPRFLERVAKLLEPADARQDRSEKAPPEGD